MLRHAIGGCNDVCGNDCPCSGSTSPRSRRKPSAASPRRRHNALPRTARR
jgi:hypothetical protein